ncbi:MULTISPECIES: fimbrial protein [Enterobacter cloacae complex]|uniref:fimbrial protein n=1 Tax=Enterobacter cloacae complex TaxID=354276 RepID=UPI001FFED28E|nr:MULTISPECIES: fimbrial protein [Enterobacter cloacae complex]MCK2177819.1 fimbrial protein [Enterobacter asburiae]
MPVKLYQLMSRPVACRPAAGAVLLLTGLLWGSTAQAAGCTGWGTDTDRYLDIAIGDLSIPAGSTLASVSWSEVMSGSSAAAALSCTDDSGQPVTNTTWTWLAGGSSGDLWTRSGETAGIGLRLTATRTDGVQAGINAADGVKATGGFNWSSLTWRVVHTSGAVDISQAMFSPGPLLKGTLTMPDGTTRTLTIRNTTTPRVVPECVVDTIPSLEFGNVSMLRFAAVGDTGPQKAFTVGVTCPVNVQTSGMTLSLTASQTDATDPGLLGNSGTATGIGVEVLDGSGNRVSANGSVAGAGFVTSTSQTWGVRFVRTGTVSAGTVRATATINVTVQ